MKKTNHRINPPDGSRMCLKRKQIQCPKCGSRIIDASKGTKTLIRVLSEERAILIKSLIQAVSSMEVTLGDK